MLRDERAMPRSCRMKKVGATQLLNILVVVMIVFSDLKLVV